MHVYAVKDDTNYPTNPNLSLQLLSMDVHKVLNTYFSVYVARILTAQILCIFPWESQRCGWITYWAIHFLLIWTTLLKWDVFLFLQKNILHQERNSRKKLSDVGSVHDVEVHRVPFGANIQGVHSVFVLTRLTIATDSKVCCPSCCVLA